LIISTLDSTLCAQNLLNITGKVEDTEGEMLAFVGILPNNDATQGVLTDIEGRFTVSSKTPIKTLTFRSVGYDNLVIDVADFLKKHPLSINGDFGVLKMKNSEASLAEVTVLAGENPADRIIRNALNNKKRNNPENLATFQCQTYNKLALDLMPNDSLFLKFIEKKDSNSKATRKRLRQFARTDSMMDHQHGFLMETVSERKFRFPNDNFERVLLNRVSGVSANSSMVAMANMVQPFSFYGDYLNLMDKMFVNPISAGSPNLYFFNIEDTLYSGVDTVFIVSFHPRKGKVFEALEGILHINTRLWAVQNVRAQPAFTTRLDMKIEQQYRYDTVAAHWFPEQLNFEASLPKYPSPYIGMRVVGKSYVSDVLFNPPLKQSDFNPEFAIVVEDNANNRDDSLWTRYHKIAPLSNREARTYEWLDSIGSRKKFNFLMTTLSSGKTPVTKHINFDWRRFIVTNQYEKTRLGIGLTTIPINPLSRARRWESSAYVGYGFADSTFKADGYLLYRINQSRQTALQFSFAQHLREPGSLSEFDRSGLVSRSIYARRFDSKEEYALAASTRVGKRIFTRLTLQTQHLTPNYDYEFVPDDPLSSRRDFRFTEMVAYAKFAYDEAQRTILGAELFAINRLPIVEVGVTIGSNHILNGHYAYQRAAVAVHQSLMIRRLGRMTYRIEAGQVWGSVPYSKLFTLNQGSAGGLSLFVVYNTFQSLSPDTLWMTDRFVNGYFRQEVGNVLYRHKWSAPFLTLLQNVAYGTLSNPSAHKGIVFDTPTRPLLESGAILDNILMVNLVNAFNLGLGGGAFYRWGYKASANWRDNTSFRLSMRITI
jgi:hypothetical protein